MVGDDTHQLLGPRLVCQKLMVEVEKVFFERGRGGWGCDDGASEGSEVVLHFSDVPSEATAQNVYCF